LMGLSFGNLDSSAMPPHVYFQKYDYSKERAKPAPLRFPRKRWGIPAHRFQVTRRAVPRHAPHSLIQGVIRYALSPIDYGLDGPPPGFSTRLDSRLC
jgi:hypothetical protein